MAKDCVRCAHVLDNGRDHQHLTDPIPGIGVGFGHQRAADSNAGGSATVKHGQTGKHDGPLSLLSRGFLRMAVWQQILHRSDWYFKTEDFLRTYYSLQIGRDLGVSRSR